MNWTTFKVNEHFADQYIRLDIRVVIFYWGGRSKRDWNSQMEFLSPFLDMYVVLFVIPMPKLLGLKKCNSWKLYCLPQSFLFNFCKQSSRHEGPERVWRINENKPRRFLPLSYNRSTTRLSGPILYAILISYEKKNDKK